jgi:hypothetical protein
LSFSFVEGIIAARTVAVIATREMGYKLGEGRRSFTERYRHLTTSLIRRLIACGVQRARVKPESEALALRG